MPSLRYPDTLRQQAIALSEKGKGIKEVLIRSGNEEFSRIHLRKMGGNISLGNYLLEDGEIPAAM